MKKTERPLLTLFLIISAATILVAGVLVKFTHENRNRISSQNHEYLIDATRKMAAGIDSELDAGFENIRFIAGILSNYQTGMELDLDQLRSFMKSSVFDFIEFDINTLPNEILDNKRAEGMLIISSVINTDAKLNKAKVFSDSFVLGRRYMEE